MDGGGRGVGMRKVIVHILCLLGSWFGIRFVFLEGGRVRLYDCQQLREEGNLSILFPSSVRPGVTPFPTTAFIFSVTWHAKELQENVVGEQGSRYRVACQKRWLII